MRIPRRHYLCLLACLPLVASASTACWSFWRVSCCLSHQETPQTPYNSSPPFVFALSHAHDFLVIALARSRSIPYVPLSALSLCPGGRGASRFCISHVFESVRDGLERGEIEREMEITRMHRWRERACVRLPVALATRFHHDSTHPSHSAFPLPRVGVLSAGASLLELPDQRIPTCISCVCMRVYTCAVCPFPGKRSPLFSPSTFKAVPARRTRRGIFIQREVFFLFCFFFFFKQTTVTREYRIRISGHVFYIQICMFLLLSIYSVNITGG